MSTSLSLNLGYYLEICKVTDFKGLVDLLIIDKLKSCMSWRTKEKIKEVELSNDKLSLQELALIADKYEI